MVKNSVMGRARRVSQFRVRRWVNAALCVSVCVMVANARAQAPDSQPARETIDNNTPRKLVHATVDSVDKLQQLLDAGAVPLACRPAVGAGEYVVTIAQEALLEQLGIQRTVILDDIRPAIRQEREQIERLEAQRGADPRGVSWYTNYKTLAQIDQRMNELAAAYPHLATFVTLGTSHQNRQINGLRISGDASVKPAVLFNGCQHAREWVSPMTVMYIAEQLLTQYDSDPEIKAIVDSVEIHVVPVTNPDGYQYTWDSNRLWRKNRRNNGGSFGVDLNRNWSVGFGGAGSSGSAGSDVYRGPSPLSEPENQALRNYYVANPQFVAHVDYHSYAQEILQPWGYVEPWSQKPPDFVGVETLGEAMREAIRAVHGMTYPNASGSGGVGLAGGIFPDWSTNEGAIGFTIELRPSSSGGGGFQLPASQILPTGQENFAGAKEMLRFATKLPVRFAAGLPEVVPAGTPTAIDFSLLPRGGLTLNPSTVKADIIGASPINIAHLGGDNYRLTLPALSCGAEVAFRIQADTVDGYRFVLPADGSAYVAVASSDIAMDDNCESNPGWTTSGVTAGQWQRGTPVNDPRTPDDPRTDGDGSGQCWLTQNQNGNTDVDNGAVVLTSPAIDMSGAGGWTISYWYFLRLSNTSGDRLLVEISSNGAAGPWTTIAVHNDDNGLEWNRHVISHDDLMAVGVALGANMRLRFTANDANPQSIVEAGVDGFRVYAECATLAADLNGDGFVNGADLAALLANWGLCADGSNCPADLTGDGSVNGADLAALLASWS